VAGAMSAAAAALAKGVLGEAAKDAYKALKGKIAAWAGHDVTRLEDNPASAAREAVVAEAINSRAETEKQELKDLARVLLTGLGDADKAGAEMRITVIATRGGMAAGRDQTINYAPPPPADGKKDA
jgi:hypothetical protein